MIICETVPLFSFLDQADAFSRADENDDSEFYSVDRFVQHLDTEALSTVDKLIEDLIVEKEPVILDLMAGWDSHISDNIKPAKVVGLGHERKRAQEK